MNAMLDPHFVTQIIIYHHHAQNWLLLESKFCAIPAHFLFHLMTSTCMKNSLQFKCNDILMEEPVNFLDKSGSEFSIK